MTLPSKRIVKRLKELQRERQAKIDEGLQSGRYRPGFTRDGRVCLVKGEEEEEMEGQVSITATNWLGLTHTITYRLTRDGRLQKRLEGEDRWRPVFKGQRVISPWEEVRKELIRNTVARMQVLAIDGCKVEEG